MVIEIVIGLIIGIALIGAGYFVRKREFSFLTDYGDTWQPINKERLGNRIGILLIIIRYYRHFNIHIRYMVYKYSWKDFGNISNH